MKKNKLVVITGNQLVHTYFLNQLGLHFKLSAVFFESVQYPDPPFKSNRERVIWDEFFLSRHKTEQSLLQICEKRHTQSNPTVYTIEKGNLNSDKTLELIKQCSPDQIIIFGTSLLGTKFLDLYPDQILNLHVGLSQFYRGSSCNFWPIYDLKPQLLGATVHFVSKRIDAGNILIQDTISLDENDSEFILMTKPIILGTKLMIEAIKQANADLAISGDSQSNGKLHQIKDFTPKAILKVKDIVNSGELKTKIKLENARLK